MENFRIFVSSPGDVGHERQRVDRVVERLNGEFAGIARLQAIRWETEFYQAYTTFQSQIPASTECDMVVAIFRGRLGTELPPEFERQPDGTPYPSGTAYEVLTAIRARRENPFPDIFVFRHTEPPSVRLDDPAAAQVQEQWRRLKGFFDTWFVTEQGHFQAAFHNFESTDDFEQQLERLLRRWLEDKVLQGHSVLWPIATKGSPFRGLAAFGAKHAAVFFGRSRDISRAVDLWKAGAERGTPFLLVVGASGSGKSSLARAGLVPRLTVPGVVPQVDVWRVASLRPSDVPGGPIASLATRLLDGPNDIPEAEVGRPPALPELAESDFRTPAELAGLLRVGGPAVATPILRTFERIGETERRRQGYDRPVRVDLVVLIDQLDELFAADFAAEERTRFAELLALFAGTRRIWVLATLRADLYERFLSEPALLALKAGGAAYDLAPPGPAELAEIVRQPAAAANLVYEADPASGERLDERLLRDVDRPDMLPLLQLALNRLFEDRVTADGETRLTLAAYTSLGGVAGVIDREAERAVASLGESELQALPRLLRRLVAVAHDGPGGASAGASGAALTIRTVPLAEVTADEASRRLVAALVEARILLTSGSGDQAGVHLAHQRVLTDWARARELVAADADFYRVRDEVEEQRRRWQAAGQRPELLLPRGLPLAEAEAVSSRFGDELSPEIRAFVAASGSRARRRQRLTAAAAVVFALFGVGATGAGVIAWNQRQYAVEQQQRAEAERARADEQRAQADQQRARAEAESTRATENEHQAQAALRETRLETARTLSTQAQLALRQPDVRRALELAIQAGNAERGALQPGQQAASEPALLAALGGARQVLHIKGASQNWWVPYRFADDHTLLYADAKAGLVAVDLQHGPKITAQVHLPQNRPITMIEPVAGTPWVAMTFDNALALVDLAKQQVAATVRAPERINGLDIDAAKHRAALAVGSGIAVVDLDKLDGDKSAAPMVIPIPEAGAVKTGQVRFIHGGSAVLASYGVNLVEYDLAENTFAPLSAELSGAGLGADRAALASVLANGLIPFVRLYPDLGDNQRFFAMAPLELQAFDAADGSVKTLPRDEADFVGISPFDQERHGQPSTEVLLLSRSRDERQEVSLKYLSGKNGLELTKEGRMMPPFETLAASPGDLGSQKPSSCMPSPQGTFVACQYWSKEIQGIVVWRLLGGDFSFERLADYPFASSGIWRPSTARLLATADNRLISTAANDTRPAAELGADWRLVASDGPYVAALSRKDSQAQVFRSVDNDTKLERVLGPVPATDISFVPGAAALLVRQTDGLSLVKLAGGQAKWTAPLGGLRAATLLADGKRLVAVAAAAAYIVDADSGRILGSAPIAPALGKPVAIDPQHGKVACVDAGGNVLAGDPAVSAPFATVAGAAKAVTQLAWSRDGQKLLIGDSDGNIQSWDGSGEAHPFLATPLNGSFRASTWPGQPAQGTVLQIAFSDDGNRLAVIRQDLPTLDIYDYPSGRRLAGLTPPWTLLRMPAEVSFAADGSIVTAWANNPMTRATPRFVTVHRLPGNFEAALAAATSRLKALNIVWTVEGPPSH